MDPIVEKVLIAGCSILATGLLTMILGKAGLLNWIIQKHKKSKSKEEQECENELIEKISKLMDEKINPIREDLNEVKQHQENNIKSLVVMVRSHLKHDMDEYIEKGYATTSEKASWKEMLKVYTDNGGNHFKEYVNQWEIIVDSLPNAPIKKRRNVAAKK